MQDLQVFMCIDCENSINEIKENLCANPFVPVRSVIYKKCKVYGIRQTLL